ncbi:MAG: hypothetical protein J2P17_01020 [Mycobacterium sp.]|nr:hypothetical protein [Mycobacterium sp.]
MSDKARRRASERADKARKRQEKEARKAKERVDRGRWFHLGMAAKRGETREHGWVTEHSVRTLNGLRRFDTARVIDPRHLEFAEYKSGNTPEDDALKQLAKDREMLERGWCGTWVRVEGFRFSPAVERELHELQRNFPDSFTVKTESRQAKQEAIDRGRDIEQGRLELFDSQRLRERERAREQRQRDLEAKRTREHAAREVEKAERERETKQREREERGREHDREQERDTWREKPWRAPEHERDQRAREDRGHEHASDEREQPLDPGLARVVELHALSFPHPPNAPPPREMERERAEHEQLARARHRERDVRGRDARQRDRGRER